MRVTVVGIRGIPKVQGGVETHAEHLYSRLADLGCNIVAVVRSRFVPAEQSTFGKVRLVRLWSPSSSGLEAFVHTILGVLYAGITRPDILHIHAVGPAIATPLARLLGLRVVVTHHGPDYDREKWGRVARWTLRMGENVGMRCSNDRIVISKVIRDSVSAMFGKDAVLIPNGVLAATPQTATDQLARFDLHPRKYFLQVSRLVPEKRQLDLLRAFVAAGPVGWKLVLVGGFDTSEYVTEVKAVAASCPDVILTGFLNGIPLAQLYSHAGAFVLPSSHEGLPIALLEALSYGLPVLASDIPSNLEVGLGSSSYFPLGDLDALASALRGLTKMPEDEQARGTRKVWVEQHYNWDRIARQTLEVYQTVIAQ